MLPRISSDEWFSVWKGPLSVLLYYYISSNQLLHLFLVITFLLCLNTRSFKATEKFLLALKKCLQFEYKCKSSKHLKKRLDTMSGVEGRGLFLNTASDVRSVSWRIWSFQLCVCNFYVSTNAVEIFSSLEGIWPFEWDSDTLLHKDGSFPLRQFWWKIGFGKSWKFSLSRVGW